MDSNFAVFKNTVLSDLNLTSCMNTIKGVCEPTNNLQECIDLCKNSKISPCKAGYYIEKGNQKICAPLFHHRNKSNIPYYRFRSPDIYPELKGAKAYVFTDLNEYPFPPDKPNSMFYKDRFILKNKESGLHLGINTSGDLSQENILKDFKDEKEDEHIHVLQFLSSEIARDKLEKYVLIRSGSLVVLNIPNTGFILENKDPTDGTELVWNINLSSTNLSAFTIISLSNKGTPNPEGTVLNYDDDFILQAKEGYLQYDSENKKIVLGKTFGTNCIFSCLPQIQVYYCDDNSGCSPIELEKCERKGFSASYQKKEVSRSPMCWNMCLGEQKFQSEYSFGFVKDEGNFNFWLTIFLSLLFLSIVIFFLYRKFKGPRV